MAPIHIRPENALKRAEELIAVSQTNAALEGLREIILSKRFRSTNHNAIEPIMLKFVELCVNQRKSKYAKECLHQYKNVVQNTNVTTIQTVVERFLEVASAKVVEVQSKSENLTLDTIEDLEAFETPESVMMTSIMSEELKEKSDREILMPWMKFLWDTYRTVLDILRNNTRLEALYQATVEQAFGFCLKYSRKNELRRLGDLLRNHLANISKFANQAHAINLNNPKSLQRLLEIRFGFLNAAAELELWQEAYRTIEEINNLLVMTKKPPKMYMMANYYEKLTKIFRVSNNHLFHAAAWNKLYIIQKTHNPQITEEELESMGARVLLSALAIPVITITKGAGLMEFDETKYKNRRISQLLKMSKPPSRSSLLKDILSKQLLKQVRPEIRELYNILEVQFHPLSICRKIEPIMAKISAVPELASYLKPLYEVILTRLLQQLSQIYTTIKLNTLAKLVTFPSPYSYSANDIEKFIMKACRRRELSISIDHQHKSLTFESDLLASAKKTIVEGPRLQSHPSEMMRTQLIALHQRLTDAVTMIDPSISELKEKAKLDAFATALKSLNDEHKNVLSRKAIINRRKEIIGTLIIRKEKEEAREKALRQKQEQEAEKIRVAEELKKREVDRLRRERDAIKKEEAKKLALDLEKKTGVALKIENYENMDARTIMAMQVEQLEQEKRETQTRHGQLAKRIDHLERAYRLEEIPLLEQDYIRQQQEDEEAYERANILRKEEAQRKHVENVEIKKRVQKMLNDFQVYQKKILDARQSDYEAKKKIADAKIEEEIEFMKEEFTQKQKELARIQAEEEAKRRKEEEEERRIAEEKRLQAEEMKNILAQKNLEDEETLKRREEQAAKQRERERIAEEKIAARGAYVPPSRRGDMGSSGTKTWRTNAPPPADRVSESAAPSWRSNDSEARKEGDWKEVNNRKSRPNNNPSWRK